MTNLAHTLKAGALFRAAIIGTVPFLSGAASRNGSSIDRRVTGAGMAQSLTLVAVTGAETGTPDARTFDAKIQHSADGSNDWADYIPPDQTTVGAVTQITAASSVAEVDVNLSGAYRYVRVVDTLAHTGGTTPKTAIATTVILAGFERTPV